MVARLPVLNAVLGPFKPARLLRGRRQRSERNAVPLGTLNAM
jgi:hypothetical protein